MCSDLDVGERLSTFRLRRRTPGSFLLVPCPRIGRALRCQGQLEAAAASVLAACPAVVSIQEQPCSIWYAWRDTPHGPQIRLLAERPHKPRRRPNNVRDTYIVPDFHVELQGERTCLVEVKPSRKLDDPVVQRKLAVARAFARQHGWTFHVVTEQQLFPGPLLANVRLLMRYRSITAPRELLDQVTGLIAEHPLTLAELLRRLSPFAQQHTIRATVFHLLACERLACDPRRAPLNGQTLIHPGGTIPWDPFDSVWAPNGCSTDAPSESSGNWPPIASSPAT